ncbi:MAG: cofactor-independent phosphoglycerate mutase [Promethearchaeia archaeon]
MKYAILVCDGAADWEIKELGNKTIFESAKTPCLDWLASYGYMGMLKTIPDGMEPGSECANMTIMGYDPRKYLTGRGPLEALSAGVSLSESDIAFRCNLITIQNNLIKDYSSGHISTEEAKELILTLQDKLGHNDCNFFPGVQYRHILRLNGKKFSENIITTPPHDILDKQYLQYLIKPKDINDNRAKLTAEFLNQLIEKSHKILIEHPINKKRKKEDKLAATHIWPWSGGKKPNMKSFKEKFGLTGSVISAVDLIFGLGIAIGFEPIYVKGATGLPDTNYKGKVDAAFKELKKKDLVYLHVEGIDEMAHTGDPKKKIAALENFDKKIVKPFIKAEKKFNNELIISVLPDHPTPIKIRTHSGDPVPFVIYNPKKARKNPLNRGFSEKEGAKGELGLIKNGDDFINLLINFK